jgi:hypothetical protein
MVLQDGKASSGLQLLVVERHQVGFGLLNLEKHFLAQFLSSLDLISLLLGHFSESLLFLPFAFFF